MQKLAHGEARDAILHFAAREVGAAVVNLQQRRAAEHHVQVAVQIVDFLHLAAPVVVFVHLVDEQETPAEAVKVVGGVDQAMVGEVGRVGRAVEHMAVVGGEVALDVLLD